VWLLIPRSWIYEVGKEGENVGEGREGKKKDQRGESGEWKGGKLPIVRESLSFGAQNFTLI